MDLRLIDKRVVQRNLNSGRITKDEYDKILAALPDVAANAELVKEKLFGGEEEPEDEDDSTEPEESEE